MNYSPHDEKTAFTPGYDLASLSQQIITCLRSAFVLGQQRTSLSLYVYHLFSLRVVVAPPPPKGEMVLLGREVGGVGATCRLHHGESC